MKKIVLLLLCASCMHAQASAPPKQLHDKHTPVPKPIASDPVADFKSFVANSSVPTEWTDVVFIPKTQKWKKNYFSLSEVRYDVKKTDSLVSPINGTVSFSIKLRISRFFDTKEEAESSNELWDIGDATYYVTAEYLIDEGKWYLNQFSVRSKFSVDANATETFLLTRTEILAGSTRWTGMRGALQRWVR